MPMTAEAVIAVMEKYKARLEDLGVETQTDGAHSRALSNIVHSRNAMLSHVLDMCDKTIEFAKAGRMAKAFRWLGFMQGALWATGVYSINEMKDHNRPPEPVEDW